MGTFLTEKGGGLERYLQGKRSGIKAASNISQIVKHFDDFVLWYYGNIISLCRNLILIFFFKIKIDEMVDQRLFNEVKSFLEYLIKEDFMYIRTYSDYLCASEEYKASTIRTIVQNINHCLRWFVLYVLKDASRILSGNIF